MIAKNFMKFVFFIMIVSLGFYQQLSIAFFRDPFMYRGQDIVGVMIHLSDLCAIMLFVTMRLQGKSFKWVIPISIPYALFFCSATISWLLTDQQLPSTSPLPYYTKFNAFLGLFHLAKGYFLMLVAFNYVDDRRKIREMFFSLASIVIMFTIIGLYQRWCGGAHRISGRTQGPNIYGGLMAMLSIIFLPMLYAQPTLRKSISSGVILSCGLVGSILAMCRAAIGAYFLAGSLATGICLIRFPVLKNLATLVFCIAVGGAMLLKAHHTLEERFVLDNALQRGLSVRASAKEFAFHIIHDQPIFGIGLNNYMSFAEGKYQDFKQGDYRIHHVLILLLTETGVVGLCFFLLQWGRILQIFFVTLRRVVVRKDAEVFAWVLGILCSLLSVHFMGLFQFCYFDNSFFPFIQIFLGVTSRIYWDSKISNIGGSKIFLKG
jgi:hypothetical protein